MIYRYDEITSTNDEAASSAYVEGDIVWAERQSAGRGQRGHRWQSGSGLDLTFSLVLEPRFLPPARQFLISQAVALGIADAMHDCGIRARIKWTNDIYAGERKLTGILIEHKLSGGAIDRSIIGIGLNVNSTQFDPALPNPVSMALLAGRTFDRAQVLEQLRTRIAERYEALRRGETEALQRDYHRSLYRLDEQHTYALPDGSRLRGTIRGVEESGALRVEHADGRVKSYLFKEIEFILKN